MSLLTFAGFCYIRSTNFENHVQGAKLSHQKDVLLMYISCLSLHTISWHLNQPGRSFLPVNHIKFHFLHRNYKTPTKTTVLRIRIRNRIHTSGFGRLVPDPEPRLLTLTHFYPFVCWKVLWILKGTVSRDFRLSVFCIIQPHIGPWLTG
jgi:hypothetical protein